MTIFFPTELTKFSDIYLLWNDLKKKDGFDIFSTVEKPLNLKNYSPSQVATLVDNEQNLVGYAVIKDDWDEKDGTHVFLIDIDVAPAYRGTDIENDLLETIEKECSLRAKADNNNVIGVNASTREKHKQMLYTKAGYKEVIRLVEMELVFTNEIIEKLRAELKDLPFKIRKPKEEEYRSVYEMIFKTQTKGSVGETEPSEEDYQNFLQNEIKHTDLGTFVWNRDEIIGQITATIDNEKAEILEVGVLPEYWRQGIATQLVMRTLIKIFEKGSMRIRLHTDAFNRYGAKSMYEKIGFRVVDESIRYRKSLE